MFTVFPGLGTAKMSLSRGSWSGPAAAWQGRQGVMPERDADDRTAREEGGEAVCWADRVCPECGRLDTGEGRPEVCQACGAEFPE